jgi:hypothetical protein
LIKGSHPFLTLSYLYSAHPLLLHIETAQGHTIRSKEGLRAECGQYWVRASTPGQDRYRSPHHSSPLPQRKIADDPFTNPQLALVIWPCATRRWMTSPCRISQAKSSLRLSTAALLYQLFEAQTQKQIPFRCSQEKGLGLASQNTCLIFPCTHLSLKRAGDHSANYDATGLKTITIRAIGLRYAGLQKVETHTVTLLWVLQRCNLNGNQ